jgi:hypothetical protein
MPTSQLSSADASGPELEEADITPENGPGDKLAEIKPEAQVASAGAPMAENGASEDSQSLEDFAESVVLGLERASLNDSMAEGQAVEADPDPADLADPADPAYPRLPDSLEEEEITQGGSNGDGDDALTGADAGIELPALDRAKGEELPLEIDSAAASMPMYIEAEDPREPDDDSSGTEGDAPDLPDAGPKHDALAEAVQFALLSVYGNGNSYDTVPDQTQMHAPDYEAGRATQSSSATANIHASSGITDDGMRPEDVILNYFNHKTQPQPPQPYAQGQYETIQGTVLHSSKAQAESVSQPDAANFSGYGTPKVERSIFVDPMQAGRIYPDLDAMTARLAKAQTEGALPVPVSGVRGPAWTGSRESGRLLGAAGLGLVGGMALAATLAVFLLSSLNDGSSPDQKVAGTPSAGRDNPTQQGPGQQAQNAAAQGGGNPLTQSAAVSPNRNIEPQTPKDEAQAGLIQVADITASSGQPAPLNITVRSPKTNEQTLVSIGGLPAGARLSSGVDAGGGNWLLPPRRLSGLTVTMPSEAIGEHRLDVQLLDSNVRTPLSDKQSFLARVTQGPAQPAAPQQISAAQNLNPQQGDAPVIIASQAPAEAQPRAQAPVSRDQPEARADQQQFAALSSQQVFQAQTVTGDAARGQSGTGGAAARLTSFPGAANIKRMPHSEVEDLIREGNRHMRDGDIVKAREYYEQAVQSGHGEAALAMGRSYDPSYFERLTPRSGEPDPALAFEWYKHAMNAGLNDTAKMRIDNLRQWMNR